MSLDERINKRRSNLILLAAHIRKSMPKLSVSDAVRIASSPAWGDPRRLARVLNPSFSNEGLFRFPQE